MTTQEAAAALGCGQRHVRTLCHLGRLQAKREPQLQADGVVWRWRWEIDPTSIAKYKQVENRRGWPRGRPRK